MHKVAPEVPLDPSQPPETNALPPTTQVPPRELPKHLADFKKYADSKFCYFAAPVDQAELINVQPKIAYQCQMKVLMEARNLHWTETKGEKSHSRIRNGCEWMGMDGNGSECPNSFFPLGIG